MRVLPVLPAEAASTLSARGLCANIIFPCLWTRMLLACWLMSAAIVGSRCGGVRGRRALLFHALLLLFLLYRSPLLAFVLVFVSPVASLCGYAAPVAAAEGAYAGVYGPCILFYLSLISCLLNLRCWAASF